MEIEWRSPAPDKPVRKRNNLKEFTAECKKRPGKWAVYKSIPMDKTAKNRLNANASHIRKTYKLETAIRIEKNAAGKEVVTLFVRWPRPKYRKTIKLTKPKELKKMPTKAKAQE
jgi:hypothetical protein